MPISARRAALRQVHKVIGLALQMHRYRTEVLEQLSAHGVCPLPTTPPELVRDFLNDLYRYELRRLRDRLLSGEVQKPNYYARVVEVRQRYALLSLKLWKWME